MMQLQWRIFRSCFSLWLCLMAGALLPSAVMAYSVQVLSSRSGGAYDEVIDALRSETLRGTELRVQYLNTNEPSWKLLESTNLVVAIGVDAANTAIQTANPGTPILCVLIPKVAFEALTGGKKENRKINYDGEGVRDKKKSTVARHEMHWGGYLQRALYFLYEGRFSGSGGHRE
jgi:hypothetical protein